jgi:hypothetical protein
MLARCHSVAKLQGWTADPAHAEAEVRRLAERVSALGNDDSLGFSAIGFALAWVCRDYDAAAAFADRALAINPNLVYAWMNRAMVSTFRGEHKEAIDQFARARRISPVGPDYYLVQGISRILTHDDWRLRGGRCDMVPNLPLTSPTG